MVPSDSFVLLHTHHKAPEQVQQQFSCCPHQAEQLNTCIMVYDLCMMPDYLLVV